MTLDQILLAIAVGLTVSEFSEVCPWAARKLVRWSAYRRYTPPSRVELRAEELAAYINDRPGKLFKLITALGFAAAAAVTRKVAAPGVAPTTPQWWPTTLTVCWLYYEIHKYADDGRHPRARTVEKSWIQLTKEVRNAASEVGVSSRLWRRGIKKLHRITGDDRWILIAGKLDILSEAMGSRMKIEDKTFFGGIGPPRTAYCRSFLTDSTITQYEAAVKTTRTEIRRLTNDFLRNSASG